MRLQRESVDSLTRPRPIRYELGWSWLWMWLWAVDTARALCSVPAARSPAARSAPAPSFSAMPAHQSTKCIWPLCSKATGNSRESRTPKISGGNSREFLKFWLELRGIYRSFVFSQFLPRCMQCRRGLAMKILSVRPSVCLSVCQTRALWQNGRKICPDFYTMRKIIWSSYLRRRMVGGGNPFYLKFWFNRPPLERNRRFWTDNRS